MTTKFISVVSGDGGGGGGGSASGCSNGAGGSGPSTSNNASTSKNTATSRQLARSRARILRAGAQVRSSSGTQSSVQSRSTGVIIGSSSSGRSLVTVPAPFVPEDLVSQAQVVLQGKSRNIIIRELQVSSPSIDSVVDFNMKLMLISAHKFRR